MSTVWATHDGPVAVVTIDRPERRNAVDSATATALADAIEAADADDAVAVTVLTGAGGAFCAGADLKALSEGDRRDLGQLGQLDQVDDALRNEWRRGLDTIGTGETLDGASRFAGGAGRHGT